MQKRMIAYALVVASSLSVYGMAESRGWASGGSKAPERIPPNQVRNSHPGTWTYLYWAHGVRGK